MCGITGYAGHRPAASVVIQALHRLEYRGYDSAGMACVQRGQFKIARAPGKLGELERLLGAEPPSTATSGMGHTRWATHGAPALRNAHPHLSNDGRLAIVHNGIIENYLELKEELLAKGYVFQSETDTEVLVNLMQECRASSPDLLSAFNQALSRARGAYAVCVMSVDEPDTLYAARMSAPLILGVGVGETFVASAIPAFLPYTRKVVFLEDGELVRATSSSFELRKVGSLAPVDHPVQTIEWDVQSAQKGGYRHFMLKEIFEQPKVLRDGLAGRVDAEGVRLQELAGLPAPSRLCVVACGTSSHAGMWGRHVMEALAGVPTQVETASEYRYKERLFFQPGELVRVSSQSGETADTLAALRRARDCGATVLGLCNVVGSSIAREADRVLYTQAGPEISVASTKAMCSQMLLLLLMALHWGRERGALPASEARAWVEGLRALPALLERELPEMRERARGLARKYSDAANFFYLGRGHCFPLALEGALKLKEISYIHAEGYASGEMKHGPIALVDPSFPTFAICLDDGLLPKVKSNVEEVQARRGKVIALTNPGVSVPAEDLWVLPRLDSWLSGFLVLPALQLFSYETADYLGKDVDQPRNLAKSVTVE